MNSYREWARSWAEASENIPKASARRLHKSKLPLLKKRMWRSSWVPYPPHTVAMTDLSATSCLSRKHCSNRGVNWGWTQNRKDEGLSDYFEQSSDGVRSSTKRNFSSKKTEKNEKTYVPFLRFPDSSQRMFHLHQSTTLDLQYHLRYIALCSPRHQYIITSAAEHYRANRPKSAKPLESPG